MNLIKVCGVWKDLKSYNSIDMIGFHFIDGEIDSIEPSVCTAIDTPYTTLRVWVFWKKDEFWNWGTLSKPDLADIILKSKDTKMNAIQINGKCDFSYLKKFSFLTILHICKKEDMPSKIDKNIDFLLIDDCVYDNIDIEAFLQPFLISVAKWISDVKWQAEKYNQSNFYSGLNLENYIR